MEQPNFYAIIPANVRYATDLSLLQKILFWEITSLSNKEWYCWASNGYFAKLYWKNPTRISTTISDMVNKWYLISEVDKSNGNIRKIYIINKIPILEKQNTPLLEKQNTSFGKTKDNNIYNNKDNNNKNISIDKSIDSEAEQSIIPYDKKEITQKIDWLIGLLKETTDQLWISYDKNKERNFAKHILTAKDYWEFCEKIWQSREEFAKNIMIASVKINYWKWICAGPMNIYKHYADVFNQTKQRATKKQNKIAFIPEA